MEDKIAQEKQRAENEKFIIHSKRKIWVRIVELIFTTIMWLYTLLVFGFFATAFWGSNEILIISAVKTMMKISNADIRLFMLWTLLLFLLILLLCLLWRFYNKKRYGSLTRRQYPASGTDQEVLALELISPEDYAKLKANRVVVFEENPIKELE